jgi:hypothetical protein
MATRLQASAVNSAPTLAPQRSQLHDYRKTIAELLTPFSKKLGIPIALEATTTSKEVLVRHSAPPGIWPFFQPNFNTGPWEYHLLITSSAGRVLEPSSHPADPGLTREVYPATPPSFPPPFAPSTTDLRLRHPPRAPPSSIPTSPDQALVWAIR